MKRTFLLIIIVVSAITGTAQNKAPLKPRPITMTEYEKARTFKIQDLDKDTYAKFENKYILDRYEMRKPYFVTGDDGLKKRIDLYKLVSKDSMQELGTVIYYTNEKGKLYTALQPNFTADGKVWEKYFEDIHSIEKEEKNFVLKLSYILSKEMSFQLFKALNNGKDLKEESGTYGSDICFPGDQLVAMADGSARLLRDVKKGDQVVTVDPVTKQSKIGTVSKLVQHQATNYAITRVLAVAANETITPNEVMVQLSAKVIAATPNHPMQTSTTQKTMGELSMGDELICLDENAGVYRTYKVYNKTEGAAGIQKVYNIEVNSGNTFVMNGVMVLQK